MVNNILIFCFCILSIIGCECVPGIDAPKKITPGYSAEALFINGVNDAESISFETDGIGIDGLVSYNESLAEFEKVQAGISFLKVFRQDKITVIYNSPVEFIKDKKYLFAVFGNGFNISSLNIDGNYPKSEGKIKYRIINISGSQSELKVELRNNNSDQINYVASKSFTDFIEYNGSQIDDIYVSNYLNEIEYSSTKIYLTAGVYLIVIKGNYPNKSKDIICNIIKLPE